MARALDLKSVDPEFKSTGFVAGIRSPWFSSSVALIHTTLPPANWHSLSVEFT